MGKRWKQAKNKAGVKKTQRFKRPCDWDGCKRRAAAKLECTTCVDGGKENPFIKHACETHYWPMRDMVKAHALKAHPVNILRVVGAGLAGQEIVE